MMLKAELDEIASIRGVTLRNIERDYLLDVCLQSLSRFSGALVFKGDTALAKFYGLNRFSEDLDFTLGRRRFDFDRMRIRVMRSYELLGIGTVPGKFEHFRQEVNVEYGLRGPLFNGRRDSLAKVTINVSMRETPQLTRLSHYSSPYKEVPGFEMRIMDAPEVLAEKVRAVMTRNKPRDVYDLWFLSRKGVGLDLDLVKRKLHIYGVTFSQESFLEAAKGKRDMWQRDLGGLIVGKLPGFDAIMQDIEEFLKRSS